MNALIVAALIIGGVTVPAEQLSAVNWQGGTAVYSHNYEGGAYFYDIEGMDVQLADGTVRKYEVSKRTTFTPLSEPWYEFLPQYSAPGNITLITCFPKTGISFWRLVVEMKPVTPVDVDFSELSSEVPDPSNGYCRSRFVSWRVFHW